MKTKFKLILILVGLTALLSSCRTSAPRLDYQALARASILLGVDINMEDKEQQDSQTKPERRRLALFYQQPL